MKLKMTECFDIWSITAFMLPFTLFMLTLAPSVTFYDSGEFITATWFLGSAHSPGYPLYLLYLKPFTWLPVGSIAFRVNLGTAVASALACQGCYHLLIALLKDRSFCCNESISRFALHAAALSGSLLLATTPRLWLQSNHDKPYPLLAFTVAMMLLFLVKWRESVRVDREQPSFWFAAAFLAGLATGLHQTVVLLIPGTLIFILVSRPKSLLNIREWLFSAACLFAGGAVQLYLPLRAAANSGQNWGDARNLSSFLWHLLRRGYPEEPHQRDLTLLFKQLAGFNIPHEFGLVGLVLLVAGIWACFAFDRAFISACAVSVVCFLLVIVGYFNPRAESIFLTEEFYTPLYLLVAVIISIGLFDIAARGAAKAELPEEFNIKHHFLVLLLFLLLPISQGMANFSSQDQHDNYLAHDYAQNTLRTLPEEAVLFTWGDSGAFPLWYMRNVERMREDVDLPHIPHLAFAWHRKELPRLQSFLEAGPGPGSQPETVFRALVVSLSNERPLLVDFSSRYSLDWNSRQPVQQGIVFGVSKKDIIDSIGEPHIWDYYILQRLNPSRWHPDQDSYKAQVIHAYCLMQSAEDLGRRGYVAEADRLLLQSEKIIPSWKDNLMQIKNQFSGGKKEKGSDR